jgi:2-amino-4-hydroxy-6-hydroxymethyldihydropteridine diphosphokinase
MPTETVFLALGTNLGDREANLTAAVAALSSRADIVFAGESPRVATKPVGGPAGQGDYLNSACRIETALPPLELLRVTQGIERVLGRRREEEPVRWGPRIIDIDILLYGARIVREPGLAVPHPRLAERHFVLAPLAALAPLAVVPGSGKTVRELLRALGG